MSYELRVMSFGCEKIFLSYVVCLQMVMMME